MANDKLSQSELQRLFAAGVKAREAFAELETLKTTFEQDVAALLETIHEARDEARGIMEDAASAAEEVFDEKSEKWQEGDRGQAYQQWVYRLRGITDGMDEDVEIEITIPDEPDWVGEMIEPDFEQVDY